MVARRPLVRIEGDVRQIPVEDSLIGATRLNGLNGDATLAQGQGVTIDINSATNVITISASGGGGDVSGKVNRSGDTMTGQLNFAPSVSVPFPSGTFDLGATAANHVIFANVAGPRSVTSFGTAPAGTTRTITSSAAAGKTIITSANLIIQGVASGGNITFLNGAAAEFLSLGGGVWRATWFTKADGTAIVASPWTGGNATMAINEAPKGALTAGATTDIMTQATGQSRNFWEISYESDVAISSLGSGPSGSTCRRVIQAIDLGGGAARLTFTHNSSGIVCPGGVDLVLTNRDIVEVASIDGVAIVTNVQRYSAAGATPGTLVQSTVAGLPSASANLAATRYCTNMAGRAGPVYSDGTNWRRFSDDSVVTV